MAFLLRSSPHSGTREKQNGLKTKAYQPQWKYISCGTLAHLLSNVEADDRVWCSVRVRNKG